MGLLLNWRAFQKPDPKPNTVNRRNLSDFSNLCFSSSENTCLFSYETLGALEAGSCQLSIFPNADLTNK